MHRARRLCELNLTLSQASPQFKSLSKLATTEFMTFLEEIHDQNSSMFGEIADSDIRGLFPRMTIVLSAWRRLKMMRKSKEKYSEADYAANVFVQTTHMVR
jgi:hypothetical protein